jgi:HAD superfamily hydrolase (TIGR01509 family)
MADSSTTACDKALILPRAILFDMDGTLTQPLLDFDQIKRDIGIGNAPILETLARMPAARRVEAERILHEHEARAAEQSTLNPGCRELLQWLRNARVLTALVTRNTRQSVNTVFDRHGLHFEVCVTREDGKYKPDPAPLLLACRRLNVDVSDAWMVGDSYHDIEAGTAAGMPTVWISHGQARTFTAVPSHVVLDLSELARCLERIHVGPH